MKSDIPALKSHPSVSAGIKAAMDNPSGAELRRCALQVNPYDYLTRHSKNTAYHSEDDYNRAIVDACKQNDVSVIAITDHFRAHTAVKLAVLAKSEGICAFIGFEANSSEGVHILCIFPEEMNIEDIGLVIGACGVSDLNSPSPQADKSCEAICKLTRERGGIAIAAHACAASGLLTTLKGQTRVKAWKSEDLSAVCLPGPRKDAPQDHRNILNNKDPAHKRTQPVAVVNANDVSDPQGFSNSSCTTLIRMSSPSIEGLRQAFLDWESRVRLNTDDIPDDHVELIAASWDGGLLDGQAIRFNAGLNALIGGRGAGKSTLIESLRHVFDLKPKGKEAQRAHDSLMKNVLKTGTRISVLLYSPRPSPQRYLLERLIPNNTVVRGENGLPLNGISPRDIIPDIECYGQHEVSELTREPELLARLLDRFVEKGGTDGLSKAEIKRKLTTSQTTIVRMGLDISQAEDDLAGLPALRQKLERFDAVGLSDRLKTKSVIDREARLFVSRREQIAQVGEHLSFLQQVKIADEAGEYSAEISPRFTLISEAESIVKSMWETIDEAKQKIEKAASDAFTRLSEVQGRWKSEVDPLNDDYQKILRDLQKEGIDGADFIATQNQIAELRQREVATKELKEKYETQKTDRSALIVDWENIKAGELRVLEKAARKVGQKLENRVRVSVRRGTTLKQLEAVFRAANTGQSTGPAIEKLKAKDDLSLPNLAEAVREGQQALASQYGFTNSFCEKLAAGGDKTAMQIEEVELPPEAILELNVAPRGNEVNWKKLDDLSTGQKATAVLLLLLLGSDEPLIVDQPEDDLDNRFIAEVVVPTMRTEKRRRQFIFSTHNANIPVLADAEQIIGLTPTVQSSVERTEVRPELVGSIDADPINHMVRDLLEGGKTAFELRRKKYGF